MALQLVEIAQEQMELFRNRKPEDVAIAIVLLSRKMSKIYDYDKNQSLELMLTRPISSEVKSCLECLGELFEDPIEASPGLPPSNYK